MGGRERRRSILWDSFACVVFAAVVIFCAAYGFRDIWFGDYVSKAHVTSEGNVEILRMVWKAVSAYERENGRVPDRIEELYGSSIHTRFGEQVVTKQLLSPNKPGASLVYIENNALFAENIGDENVAVAYVSAPHQSYVLYADGSVREMDDQQLERALDAIERPNRRALEE